jgi:hypothetical protein
MNNQQVYPTDVLPEDRKQERIRELERALEKAEAQRDEAVKVLKEIHVLSTGGPIWSKSKAALERLEVNDIRHPLDVGAKKWRRWSNEP